MLQQDDFTKRIAFVMEHFGLNASSFADKIGVQRSSISHILSGRNKPSLDFILKISDLFSELNLYWLLNGTGSFLKEDSESIFEVQKENHPTPILKNNTPNEEQKPTMESVNFAKQPPELNFPTSSLSNKDIQKIVIFYKDGTFEDFNPTCKK